MKKALALIFCFLLLFSACTASAANVKVRYQVAYKQELARSMLSIINENRTKDKVWQWKPDNKTKQYFSGLAPLQYDYNLETIAMRRAAELAIYCSHTRPDGSDCFTCFPTSVSSFYYGENIAYSWSSHGSSMCSTAESTFWVWWEEDEPYEYQGHRRNMLDKDFKYIGIGCVYVNNAYYWAQAFSMNPISASHALPTPTTVEASLYSGAYKSIGPLRAEPESLTIGIDDSVTLPAVTFDGDYSSYLTDVTVIDPPFTAGSGIISVSGGKVTGKEAGETTLSVTVGSRTVSVNVKVAGACEHADKKTGDLNGDGAVNGKDSMLLLQYLAGWDVSFDSENADINGDGTVNGKDSMLLLQYLAGWESAYIR